MIQNEMKINNEIESIVIKKIKFKYINIQNTNKFG